MHKLCSVSERSYFQLQKCTLNKVQLAKTHFACLTFSNQLLSIYCAYANQKPQFSLKTNCKNEEHHMIPGMAGNVRRREDMQEQRCQFIIGYQKAHFISGCKIIIMHKWCVIFKMLLTSMYCIAYFLNC